MVPVKTTTTQLAKEVFTALKKILSDINYQTPRSENDVIGCMVFIHYKDNDTGMTAFGENNIKQVIRLLVQSTQKPVEKPPEGTQIDIT